MNFVAGLTVPNLAVVKLAPDGTIKLYNHSGTTHAVLDVEGWYVDGTSTGRGLFVALVPARILDTRSPGSSPVGPDESAQIAVAGVGGVPATIALGDGTKLPIVGGVVVNVTVTAPTSDGYLTVFPPDVPRPTSSNLNFVAGQTVPNLVMSRVPTRGRRSGVSRSTTSWDPRM